MPHRSGDAAEVGRRSHPRRRASWEDPTRARPRPQEQDPRTGAPRPRQGVPATTGQTARVRLAPPAPTDTAPIPVVGAVPAPARSANGDPRLRELPTGSLLVRAPEPVAPRPAEFAPEPAPLPRRRIRTAFVAALAVLGLFLVNALPAFAGEALSAPPVEGVSDGDEQHMAVDASVGTRPASTDPMTGDLAAPAGPAWVLPVDGRLGDAFGPRPHQPVPGVSLFHRGQDVVARCGSPVVAAAAGVVRTATYWGTYGNWILVDHGNGIQTGYAHEMRMSVVPGQQVQAGQTIGLVGATGAATGCHLHLEVHLNGVAVNPAPYFAARGVPLGR